MRRILTLLCLLAISGMGYTSAVEMPDSSISIVDKAKVKAWMSDARHKMYEFDWRGALSLYREVLVVDPSNAKAEYRSAECLYNIYNYKYAQEHLETAEKLGGNDIDKEFKYLEARILHRMKKFDESIKAFQAFQSTLKSEKDKKYYDIDQRIKDCEFAKSAMADPKPVKLLTVTAEINTRYREYGAHITNDGKHMYFTSRRADSKGGALAPDGAFYEDIYVCKWNQETGTWVEPEHAPGRLNEDQHEAVCYVYEDIEDGDLTMYVTVNAVGGTMSSDLAYSRLSKKGTWGKPRYLPKKTKKNGGINTSFMETSAALTADGKTMFFVAESLKGQGRGDIYMATSKGSKWNAPVNLGDVVNTAGDENTLWVTPDGKHLFFSSNGHQGMGGYDIFVSSMVDGKWTKPKNLGYPFNSVNHDTHFRLFDLNNKATFSSVREGGEGYQDIYIVDLKGYKFW